MVKLLTDKSNPQAYKILVAAKYAGVQVEVPEFNFGTDNKTKEFLEKSPLGKVPVLETPEGAIFEANACARYIARQTENHLYGANKHEAAQVDQWIDFASSEIELPAAVWVFPILGLIDNNPAATQKAKGDIRNVLEVLNKHFATKTYLVGERITLADIVVALSLLRVYERVLDTGFRSKFTNTNRWFTTVVNQPNVKAVVGDVKLCTKMEVAKDAPKKEEAKKEEKPKQEQKPKEQKPKEQPKKKEADEEEEESFEDEKPKGKNPLDALPPSKLNLDEWKRTYSNNDTRSVAIPFFWDKYDPEGYCIYFCEYKYNDELGKAFMTSNLITGWFQRCEKLRKYGFGSILIFGDEPKTEIAGCWLFRGNEVPAEMRECDDYEHYTWTKADTNDAATKEKINDFWAWDGSFGGRALPFNQGKAFK